MSGAPDAGWNNSDLNALKTVPGSAFEAVDVSSLKVSNTSYAVAGAPPPPPPPPPPPRRPAELVSNGGFETSLAGWKWSNKRYDGVACLHRRSRWLVLGGARSHQDGRRDPRRLDEHRRLDDDRRDLHRVGLGARAGRTHGARCGYASSAARP